MLHAFTTQDVLELLVNSFSAAADGICSYNNENLVFFSRIGNRHIYTCSNSIDIMFHTVITHGVLEQLVNSFSAAAYGICS